MYIENVTLPAVPAETANYTASDLRGFLLVETFQKEQYENQYVDFLKVVFDATKNPNDWKSPVTIDTRSLSWEQVQWVKNAIVWFQGCNLNQIKEETGLLFSPGYQAW